MSQYADNEFLCTSESVTEGHPDKVSDQISDGVLDAILKEDPYARVACETLVNTGLVVVSGEITTSAYVDIQNIVRETMASTGRWKLARIPAATMNSMSRARATRE